MASSHGSLLPLLLSQAASYGLQGELATRLGWSSAGPEVIVPFAMQTLIVRTLTLVVKVPPSRLLLPKEPTRSVPLVMSPQVLPLGDGRACVGTRLGQGRAGR
jgi:hypothetical protein